MSLFRSEKMGLYNLIMPYESAWHILNCLKKKKFTPIISFKNNYFFFFFFSFFFFPLEKNWEKYPHYILLKMKICLIVLIKAM